MDISWTPKARHTYFKVLDHLEKAWTEREIQNFINEVDSLLDQINQNPVMFEESRKKKNVRKGFITKQNPRLSLLSWLAWSFVLLRSPPFWRFALPALFAAHCKALR